MLPPDDFPQYRRYRAPIHTGEKFFDPARVEVPRLVADNLRRSAAHRLVMGNRSLTDLAATAKSELVRLASEYSVRYSDSLPQFTSPTPLILSGHQPELFHPGVWFKNFVLHDVARECGGVGINLIIDNDLRGSTSIRVPTGSVQEPRVESVRFDGDVPDFPFEESGVVDRAVFESFGLRVEGLLRPLLQDPLIRTFWPRVVARSQHDNNLGKCIAGARHQLELEWGLRTLEIPLSSICGTDTFRTFVVHLLRELPQLHQIYNSSLHEYRRANRIRSHSHPVPELEALDGGWLEAPLWIWNRGDPRRHRLFARSRGSSLEIMDLVPTRPLLTLSDVPDKAVAELGDIEQAGVKIRPRALVTTLYSRLLLSDFFVHGIGGGKYDQLTDVIIRRWLKVDPPAFLVATATARLPIEFPNVEPFELNRIDSLLRELTFNPDRHVESNQQTSHWIEMKRDWLKKDLSATESAQPRHQAITESNQSLQPFVAEKRARLDSQRAQHIESLRRARVLGSREYSFCLFPEATLRHLLLDNA